MDENLLKKIWEICRRLRKRKKNNKTFNYNLFDPFRYLNNFLMLTCSSSPGAGTLPLSNLDHNWFSPRKISKAPVDISDDSTCISN